MNDDFHLFVGVDWASEEHEVCAVDPGGTGVGARAFKHSGDGMADLCAWLLDKGKPGSIAIAIEVPHGAVVETLLERGFAVFSINPKQLDRFRDRFTMAGAKDDRRDALVLADSLRTDTHLFRRLAPQPAQIIELASGVASTTSCRRSEAASSTRCVRSWAATSPPSSKLPQIPAKTGPSPSSLPSPITPPR